MVSEVWSPWCKSKETPESAVEITIVKQESTGNLTSPLAPSDTPPRSSQNSFINRNQIFKYELLGLILIQNTIIMLFLMMKSVSWSQQKEGSHFPTEALSVSFDGGDRDNQYSELVLKSKHWFLMFCFYFIVFHDFLDFLCLMSLLESFFFCAEVSWLCLSFSSV